MTEKVFGLNLMKQLFFHICSVYLSKGSTTASDQYRCNKDKCPWHPTRLPEGWGTYLLPCKPTRMHCSAPARAQSLRFPLQSWTDLSYMVPASRKRKDPAASEDAPQWLDPTSCCTASTQLPAPSHRVINLTVPFPLWLTSISMHYSVTNYNWVQASERMCN